MTIEKEELGNLIRNISEERSLLPKLEAIIVDPETRYRQSGYLLLALTGVYMIQKGYTYEQILQICEQGIKQLERPQLDDIAPLVLSLTTSKGHIDQVKPKIDGLFIGEDQNAGKLILEAAAETMLPMIQQKVLSPVGISVVLDSGRRHLIEMRDNGENASFQDTSV
jgi:hypothetical protein